MYTWCTSKQTHKHRHRSISAKETYISAKETYIHQKRRVNTIRVQFLQRLVYTMTDLYTPSQKRPKSPQKRPIYTIKDVHTPSEIYFCRDLYTTTDTMRDLCQQKRPISPQKRPIYTRDVFLKRLIYTKIDLHTPSEICTSTKETSIHKRDQYLRKRDQYLRKREANICAKETVV